MTNIEMSAMHSIIRMANALERIADALVAKDNTEQQRKEAKEQGLRLMTAIRKCQGE